MKKPFTHWSVFAFLFAAWLAGPLRAGEARSAASTKHSLWKVEGRTNVVYILGSIHVLKDEDYPLPPVMESAFSNASVAVFEADVDELSRPEVQLRLMTQARLPAGRTLEDELPPDLYSNLVKYAASAGLPAGMIEQFKPAMAIVMVEMFELLKLGVNPERGVDKYFFERARRQGKTIIPLETAEFQMSLITDFPKDETDQLVRTSLAEIDDTRKHYEEIRAAWRVGDEAPLAKYLNQAVTETPALYKRLLTDRNRAWLPKIEELLRGNRNAIVIVGAGHLVGTDGVIDLLKKNKWKITQL